MSLRIAAQPDNSKVAITTLKIHIRLLIRPSITAQVYFYLGKVIILPLLSVTFPFPVTYTKPYSSKSINERGLFSSLLRI